MSIKTVLIQISSLCNLNCSYCYVPNRKELQKMDLSTIEAIFKKLLQSNLTSNQLKVVFHVGEPLVIPIHYYETIFRIADSYNIFNKTIDYHLQTNGTLINQKWANFFKTHRIRIGISTDGPDFLHNKSRKDWKNKGSHHLVMKGIKILQENHIPYGGICVLTKESLDYPEEIFSFFYENQFEAVLFNIEEKEGAHQNSSMISSSEEQAEIAIKYRQFMDSLFEQWLSFGGKFKIVNFSSKIDFLIKKRATQNLVYQSDVAIGLKTLIIQKNGNITTFAQELENGLPTHKDAFVIGNINDCEDIEDLIRSPIYTDMNKQIKKGILKCQEQCPYFDFCGGGSPGNKLYETGSFESTETEFCKIHIQTLTDLVLDKLTTVKPEFVLSSLAPQCRNS